jgi:hypothetical protein
MNVDGSLGNKYQGPQITRPFDFGTDAIEKQRVSQGQSLIDADFEYGLQATKWQTYSDVRKTPSFFEIPGTDFLLLPTSNVFSDGSSPSTITVSNVYTQSGASLVNTPISVQGLNDNTGDFDKAQGFFVLTGVTNLSYTPTGNSQSVGTSLTLTGLTSAIFTGAGFVVYLSGFTPAAVNGPWTTLAGSSASQIVIPYTGGAVGTMVNGTITSISISYQSKGLVGVSGTQTNLITNATTIRKAGFYSSSNVSIGNMYLRLPSNPTFSGTTITVTTSNTHGLLPGTPISVSGFTGSGTLINGGFIILSTPTQTTFTYNLYSTTPPTTITGYYTGSAGTGFIYVQSYSSFVHRPFDGGVLISPIIPAFGASIIRQSKKVFRYQSGKGLMWSSGTLFCPNNDLVSVSASGTAIGSIITVITGIPHGGPQLGAVVVLKGITTPGYNGTYVINSIINSVSLTLVANQTLASQFPVLGSQPRFIMQNWHGSSSRIGTFDEQNGIFWEYDGQTLWAVKRSSTYQIIGQCFIAQGSNNLYGIGSRFSDQLKVNDKITIKGMCHVITSITSQTVATLNPPYRGASSILSSSPATVCRIAEVRTPQSQFNRDTCDGNGPSGFKFDQTKMQMMGLQYTWYGAGFIDFMIRGSDGNWVYAHRYRQNNVNDEAYMRTGNMSVRYELAVETSHVNSILSQPMGPSDTTLTVSDPVTYWPNAGTLMIDNELVSYTSKTGTYTVGGLTRGNALTYNVIDTPNTILSAGSSNLHTNVYTASYALGLSSMTIQQMTVTGVANTIIASANNTAPLSGSSSYASGSTGFSTDSSGNATFTFATTNGGFVYLYPIGSQITLSGYPGSFTVTNISSTTLNFSMGSNYASIAGTLANVSSVTNQQYAIIAQSSALSTAFGNQVVITGFTITTSGPGINSTFTLVTSTVNYIKFVYPYTISQSGVTNGSINSQSVTISFTLTSPFTSYVIPVGQTFTVTGSSGGTALPNGTYTIATSTTYGSVTILPSTPAVYSTSSGVYWTQVASLGFTGQTSSIPFPIGSNAYVSGVYPSTFNGTYQITNSSPATATASYTIVPSGSSSSIAGSGTTVAPTGSGAITIVGSTASFPIPLTSWMTSGIPITIATTTSSTGTTTGLQGTWTTLAGTNSTTVVISSSGGATGTINTTGTITPIGAQIGSLLPTQMVSAVINNSTASTITTGTATINFYNNISITGVTTTNGTGGSNVFTFSSQVVNPFVVGSTVYLSGFTDSNYTPLNNTTYTVLACTPTTITLSFAVPSSGTVTSGTPTIKIGTGNPIPYMANQLISLNGINPSTTSSGAYINSQFTVGSGTATQVTFTSSALALGSSTLTVAPSTGAGYITQIVGTSVSITLSTTTSWMSQGIQIAIYSTTVTSGTSTVLQGQWITLAGTNSTTVVIGYTGPSVGNINTAGTISTLGNISLSAVPSTAYLVSTTCVPSLTHWGSAFIMDGLFDQDRGYLFNYQTNANSVSLAANATSNLFCIRLSPSVSNGIVGDLGTRDLLNRAQLLLQRLDVWAQSTAGAGSVVISGILNPVFTSTNQVTYPVIASGWLWTPINNSVNGSQPSFTQVSTTINNGTNYQYVAGSGERVFSTISNAGSQNSIDLSGLKEVCNGVIGGNNCFPDGPDTLLIQLTNVGSTAITAYSLNLFWGEAQA